MTIQLKEKLNKLAGEKGITKKELKELLIKISDPWEEAMGILKRKINAIKYQKKMRREWER